jgi:hypothetical protein
MQKILIAPKRCPNCRISYACLRSRGEGSKIVRWQSLGTATFALSLLVAPAAIGEVHAQAIPPSAFTPAPPGFVPPYEIMRTVRSVGLDPLAPPLREGTTYVLRATDFRGVLMRVVVDANTGTIRAVNRIVPAPVMPGQIGMMPPPYAAPPDDMPPYGMPPYRGPPQLDASQPPPNGQASLLPPFAPRQPGARSGAHANTLPLPRPRPATLASRNVRSDIKSAVVPAVAATAPSPPSAGQNNASEKAAATVKPEQTTALPAPQIAPTPVKPGKAPPSPPIND